MTAIQGPVGPAGAPGFPGAPGSKVSHTCYSPEENYLSFKKYLGLKGV